MRETIYLKLEKSSEVKKETVAVSDVATVWCKNTVIRNRFSSMSVMDEKPKAGQRYIVTVMKIIEMAEKQFPNLDVSSIGETECVVEVKKNKADNKFIEGAKVALICFVLFFGAGFSIMAFNNDVDIERLFLNIVKYTVADSELGESIIKLFYGIGVFLGITVFYNHFGSGKISDDPTPIEVEMRDYEDSINNALIEDYHRNEGRRDVK